MNNNITLVGHVGKTITTKSFEDTGAQVVKFSIAVKEFSKSDEDKAMWIDVDAWNGLGERVLNLLTTGREVVISGRLSINEFTKKVQGVEVKMKNPVVKLSSFHVCGPKPKTLEEAQPEEAQTDASEA